MNVIALKADGGMRDALSIFDQVVRFHPDGNITYKSVIENLNVLDYEYYFRLTDCFLENKVSDALLLFNDVLNKGIRTEVTLLPDFHLISATCWLVKMLPRSSCLR